MTHNITLQPGSISLTDSGRKVWDSGLLTCALATPAQFTVTPTFSYDDIIKDNAYYWSFAAATPPAISTEYGIGYITAVPQEWGPGGPNVLSDTLLGTVPSGTDYLDVAAVISRTVNPSQLLGDALSPMFPQGKQMRLLGGGLVIEQAADFVRSMEVVLSGTNVYLRRRQSYANDSTLESRWSLTNNAGDNGALTWGSQKGYPVSVISGSGNHNHLGASPLWQRGSANQLASIPLADTTNFLSTYAATLVITPGYFITAAQPVTAPASKSLIRTYASVAQISGVSAQTFSSVPFGAADSTRNVLVLVSWVRASGTAAAVSSVTIGGVTATAIVAPAPTTVLGFGIYMAAVPSGTSGNVVVNFASTNVAEVSVVSFSLYHLSSTSPSSTNSAAGAASMSLTTPSGGFAFVVGVFAGQVSLLGILFRGTYKSVPLGSGAHLAGFQPTTGATLSVSASAGTISAAGATFS